MKAFLNVFGQFSEIDFRDSRFGFEHDAIPSTRLTVASLYSFPLIVLKSSARAIDAKHTIKITKIGNFIPGDAEAFHRVLKESHALVKQTSPATASRGAATMC